MTSKSSCTSLNLKNVEVKFPYSPYDLQKNMMEMMIDSAQQVMNDLVEMFELMRLIIDTANNIFYFMNRKKTP
jgi:hypothetical protein